MSSFVFHSSLLTVKCVNLVVAHDGFLCVTRNGANIANKNSNYNGGALLPYDAEYVGSSVSQYAKKVNKQVH